MKRRTRRVAVQLTSARLINSMTGASPDWLVSSADRSLCIALIKGCESCEQAIATPRRIFRRACHPPLRRALRVSRSSFRIGYGLKMSNNRNNTKATITIVTENDGHNASGASAINCPLTSSITIT